MIVGWEVPPSGTIANGTWQVGEDIQPGIYRTAGSSEGLQLDEEGRDQGRQCYWSRTEEDDPNSLYPSIFVFPSEDEGLSHDPMYVELFPTDKYFYSQDCQPWTKVD